MKKLKNSLSYFVVLALMLSCGVAFVGCGKASATATASGRYDATPVNEKGYRIDFSTTDGEYDYHFINLGKVEKMPISSGDMWHYDGRTSIKLTYTVKEGDSGSLTTSMTSAWSKTIETTNAWNMSIYAEAAASYSGFGFKAHAKAEFAEDWSQTTNATDSSSRSDSVSTLNTWAREHTETMEFNIGSDCKDVGYYRFSVFATCDVYAIAVRDRTTDKYFCMYDFCARPGSLFSAIDYSPINFDEINYEKKLSISDEVFKELIEQEVTLKREVKFISGSETVKTQLVTHAEYATAPEMQSTETQSFKGWSLNGGSTVVDVAETKITSDTTFTAVWGEKEWQVVYMKSWDESPKCTSSFNLAELAQVKGITVPKDPTLIRITVTAKMNLVSDSPQSIASGGTSLATFSDVITFDNKASGKITYTYSYLFYYISGYSAQSNLHAVFACDFGDNTIVITKTTDSSSNLDKSLVNESCLAITKIEFFM